MKYLKQATHLYSRSNTACYFFEKIIDGEFLPQTPYFF